MPTSPSAVKRLKQSLKRRMHNRITKKIIKTLTKRTMSNSSPGQDRPLTKPQHYTRFLGRRARVRLREAAEGHKQLTGELVGASERDVTIAAGDGIVTIPYEHIVRSNLVPGD